VVKYSLTAIRVLGYESEAVFLCLWGPALGEVSKIVGLRTRSSSRILGGDKIIDRHCDGKG
jgi:hypothetical protein